MQTLQDDCRDRVEHLRASLLSLYDSIGADVDRPRDVARTLKLPASLTWNISKLMKSADGLSAVPHIPGTKSLERVLSATQTQGASDAAVAKVRHAASEFEEMIEIHVGDRATLDVIVDGLGVGTTDGTVNSRKKAYQGESAIYGIQARTNLTCYFLAPNQDNPGMLDLVEILGYFGVRRLRPDVRMPLLVQRRWSIEEQDFVTAAWRPLVDDAPSVFLPEFQKDGDPEFEMVDVDGGFDVFVKPGRIGNGGKFDCVYADKLHAGVSRYKVGADTTGELGGMPTVPTEHLLVDIIAHRDVAFALQTEQIIFARSLTSADGRTSRGTQLPLPIRCEPYELAGSPPVVATSAVPGYARLLDHVFGSLGWNPSDFRGSRLEMKYPPLGAAVNRRFELPIAPARGCNTRTDRG